MKTSKTLNTLKVKEVAKGDFRHAKCGGQMACGGTVKRQMPTGFGFKGGKFVVDVVRQTGYTGYCMKCFKEGAWYTTTKKKTIVPKKINQKIKAIKE